LSIAQPLNTIDISVHTNPIDNSELSIDIHNPDRASYQVNIYDLTGKSVYSKEHNAPEGDSNYFFKVRIPEARPGMYLLHILSGNLFAKEKVMVR
jgi:hypothetical protein